MGYNLKILLPVKDQYEGDDLQDIHDDLINLRLFEEIGHQFFDYFSPWVGSDHSGCFFGKDNPDRMVHSALAWNDQITNALKRELEKIIPFKTADDIIKYFEDDWMNVYHLREALNSYDNHFQFGEDHLVYDKYGDYSVRIPEEMLNDILDHPEDYAIIDVIYH